MLLTSPSYVDYSLPRLKLAQVLVWPVLAAIEPIIASNLEMVQGYTLVTLDDGGCVC